MPATVLGETYTVPSRMQSRKGEYVKTYEEKIDETDRASRLVKLK